jgi:hypothetical protein
MQVHVMMAVYVIQNQPGFLKSLKLRAYLTGKLSSNIHLEKERKSRPDKIGSEPSLSIDQVGNRLWR